MVDRIERFFEVSKYDIYLTTNSKGISNIKYKINTVGDGIHSRAKSCCVSEKNWLLLLLTDE